MLDIFDITEKPLKLKIRAGHAETKLSTVNCRKSNKLEFRLKDIRQKYLGMLSF